jgi:hypothetical protein
MADVTNVALGVCSVTVDGVDIGHTKGGCEVTYEPNYHTVTVDKYGETPVDERLNGETLMVKVPFAEYTLSNLEKAIPFTTRAGAADARRLMGSSAGQKGRNKAVALVLHPINEGTRRFDIVLYKAFAHSAVTLNHKNDEERIIEVEFVALVDETKSDGNYLGLVGDSTA